MSCRRPRGEMPPATGDIFFDAHEYPAVIPSRRTALIQTSDGNVEIGEIPMPLMAANDILVKVVAVALNPTDHKMTQNFPSPGAIIGCDFAGIIVAIGKEVEKKTGSLELGDRVCGPIHGSNPVDPTSGAFAEYLSTPSDIVMRVPDGVSWEEAAAIGGTGHGSLCLALWHYLNIPGCPQQPARYPEYFLVYGGSTATGTMALQLLKLSGLNPIAICSPHNFALAKSYGATEVFDYANADCAADIRAYTNDSLFYALDCISDQQSVAICYAAIGRAGGRYASLEYILPAFLTRKAITSHFVLGYEMFGKVVALGGPYQRDPNPALRNIAVRWFTIMQPLWNSEKIKAHPVKTIEDGWLGVIKGLDLLRSRKVSGEKLVSRIE